MPQKERDVYGNCLVIVIVFLTALVILDWYVRQPKTSEDTCPEWTGYKEATCEIETPGFLGPTHYPTTVDFSMWEVAQMTLTGGLFEFSPGPGILLYHDNGQEVDLDWRITLDAGTYIIKNTNPPNENAHFSMYSQLIDSRITYSLKYARKTSP